MNEKTGPDAVRPTRWSTPKSDSGPTREKRVTTQKQKTGNEQSEMLGRRGCGGGDGKKDQKKENAPPPARALTVKGEHLVTDRKE